ncbi:hypothetical protein [Moraxella sp. ZY210820]|uniref:hypothetical protein n=1 Tax=unclassified Moraxella TaxID=2685852 RepID=UPI00272FA7B4|nr:hypothetical protein [Moraxella sp. ZY210820]WLF83259.1 hypothetical protein LU301_08290 [Moraxella sp. ZY210820]
MKNILIKFFAISYLFVVAGLGLITSHFYFNHKAENGGGIPAETELTIVEGKVTEGRDVTLETRRRAGLNSKEQFYELDIKQKTGDVVKLRLDHSLNKEHLGQVLQENIVAKYDKSDENMTYDIQMKGQSIITYQDMAKMAQDKANKQAGFFSDGVMLKTGFSWLIMGAIGLFLRQLLKRSQKKTENVE